MKDSNCLFCKIVAGEEPSQKLWENEDFLAIKNKYPIAPVHILVLPKDHLEKKNIRTGNAGVFWGKMMASVFEVVHLLGLDFTGYKLVNNGAGYNHFEHEHVHVIGGSKQEPGGST